MLFESWNIVLARFRRSLNIRQIHNARAGDVPWVLERVLGSLDHEPGGLGVLDGLRLGGPGGAVDAEGLRLCEAGGDGVEGGDVLVADGHLLPGLLLLGCRCGCGCGRRLLVELLDLVRGEWLAGLLADRGAAIAVRRRDGEGTGGL